MKKVVTWCISIGMLMTFLTGCTPKREFDTSPEFNLETDYNTNYDQFGYSSQFAETEDGYYYLTREKFLRFIDKETMKEIALCNKPDCSHWRGDEEKCNSYMGAMAPAELFYYKGKLYGFTDRSSADELGFTGVGLCEIAKDGSSIKKVWEVDWKGKSSGQFQSGILHRGVYYFYTNNDKDISIYAYDLETKKCKCIFDEPNRDGTSLFAAGDFLYWRYVDGELSDHAVVRYQISTGEVKIFEGYFHAVVGGDRIYFRRWEEKTDSLISYTGRDGKNMVNTDVPLEGRLHGGKEYLFGIIESGGKNTITVYDTETMRLVDELDITNLCEGVRFDYVLSGNDEVFFVTNIERGHIFYAYKSAIGTPDFQWYEVEKVN